MIQRRWGAGSGSSGLVSTTSSPSCRALSLSSPTSSLLDSGQRRLATAVITIPTTTCELGGVPALLLPKTFCSNGAWVKPRQPAQMGKGQLRYPPQRNTGVFGNERGTMSAGGAQGRRRSSRLFGRRSTDLSGAHVIFKTSDQIGRQYF